MINRPAFIYWLDMRKYEHIPFRYDRDILCCAIERYLVKSYCFNIKPTYNPTYYQCRKNVDILFDAFMGESPFRHSTIEAMSKSMTYDGPAVKLKLVDGPCIIITR